VVCDTAVVQLRELAAWLRDYRDRLGHEPERLTQIEDRLDVIQRLKKKYGATVEQLCLLAEDLRRQLEGLDTAETRLADLQRRLDEERAKAGHLAGRLSQGRKRAASRLEKRVQDELAALRMDRTRFQVALDSSCDGADLGPTGCDRIEYLFSANEGEPLQPLARVASGGELSRVMLAMKSVLAETDHVPILIFDEVDAGVGGAVAAVMGKRLRALADYHQVFCITHLPQIAAQAEAHYLVEKGVVKKRTVTQVRRLDQKARKDEVARMLGGLAITKAMRDTAADMIDEAQNPS
ncbi:MAG: DNA repair protein RecN, partial [Nitrospirales bacterium]